MKLGAGLAILGLFLLISGTVQAQTVSLSYAVNYNGTPYPGGSIVIAASFTNSGQVQLRVTDFSLIADFGTFSASTGLPLTINAGAVRELDMMMSIPSSVSVGGHQLTASAVFQYQDPSTMQWMTPSTSPQTVQSTLQVQQNPTTLLWIGFGVLGVAVLLVALAVVYFSRLRSKQKPTVPGQQVPGPVALFPCETCCLPGRGMHGHPFLSMDTFSCAKVSGRGEVSNSLSALQEEKKENAIFSHLDARVSDLHE